MHRTLRGRGTSALRGSGFHHGVSRDLRLGQRATGRDEPVAVALLVPTAQRERSLDVGANKILAENPLPMSEQLCEELIEIGVRGDDVGRGHEPRV